MTTRDNIIYYIITAVVFVGIVVCSVWSQPDATNTEMNEEKQRLIEVITPYAPIINALAVLTSTVFIIWTTYFRKTRSERIDELMEEMRILLSDRGITGVHVRDKDRFLDQFFGELSPRFQKPKYKVLHLYALRELSRQGRLSVYH